MKLSVGQFVMRRPDFQKGNWWTLCKEAGVDPAAPVKIDELNDRGPIFLAINPWPWGKSFFTPCAPLDTKLEDYL